MTEQRTGPFPLFPEILAPMAIIMAITWVAMYLTPQGSPPAILATGFFTGGIAATALLILTFELSGRWGRSGKR